MSNVKSAFSVFLVATLGLACGNQGLNSQGLGEGGRSGTGASGGVLAERGSDSGGAGPRGAGEAGGSYQGSGGDAAGGTVSSGGSVSYGGRGGLNTGGSAGTNTGASATGGRGVANTGGSMAGGRTGANTGGNAVGGTSGTGGSTCPFIACLIPNCPGGTTPNPNNPCGCPICAPAPLGAGGGADTAGGQPGPTSNGGAAGSWTGTPGRGTSCNPISMVAEQTNPCGRTVGIAYSPDGQMLAAGSQTAAPNVHLWRLTDGALLHDIEGIGDVTYSVAFSPDSKILATAGEVSGGTIEAVTPNIVKVWDVATGTLLQTIPATCGFYADSVSFSHDGTLLATAGASGAVEIWRVSDGARVTAISIPGTTYNVHFSSDDSHLIAAGTGGPNVTVWDLLTGAKTLTLTGTSSDQVDGAFSPDGLRIATTGDGGTVKFWDATTGNLLQTLSGHGVMESHVVWIDDSRLVSDDWQGKVVLWTASADRFSPAKAWSIGAQALGLAVSPDKSFVAVAGDNGITFLAP